MPSSEFFRPRTLSIIFGGFFLVMAILAGYSGSVLGYHYAPGMTRWALAAYVVAGAVFLAGISLAAIWTLRLLDERIARLERMAGPDPAIVEEIASQEGVSEDVPPPLQESPAPSGEPADRDIDELLVSLEQMEEEAGTVEATDIAETAAPMEEPAEKAPAPPPAKDRVAVQALQVLREKRDAVLWYLMGPVLASIAVIGLSAAMLPGSDAFLQYYYQFNTALLLGIGYTFAGVAAYVAASILVLLRNR
jgi:hypothetical protein